MIDDMEMFKELEAVGVGIGSQEIGDLPDLVEELGFDAALDNVVGWIIQKALSDDATSYMSFLSIALLMLVWCLTACFS